MTTSIITNRDERFARAAWSAMTEDADTHASSVITDHGYVDALDAVTDSTRAAELRERSDDMARAITLARPVHVAQALSDADARSIHLVDPLTVRGMSDLGERTPHLLWVRGDITSLDAEPALTWSGARAASAYGESVTREIVADLAQAGISIHSSSAYGIDSARHRAALAVGGSTVSWQAGGIDRAYCAGHAQLLERVTDTPGSAVVSELPLGTAPTQWRFLTRVRLLVASTRSWMAIWIIEHRQPGRRPGRPAPGTDQLGLQRTTPRIRSHGDHQHHRRPRPAPVQARCGERLRKAGEGHRGPSLGPFERERASWRVSALDRLHSTDSALQVRVSRSGRVRRGEVGSLPISTL